MQKLQHQISRYEQFLLPAIVLITLAVFSPVAWHDFINYDDDVFVYSNPAINAGLTLEGIRWAFTTVHEVNWIPLTWISHMLDVTLFGMNAGGHHIVNVLFHSASSALLFLLLKRSTGSPWRSAAVAALFALHPLHVESVAWVAERKDVLSTFFGMLTIYAYIRYAEKPDLLRYFLTGFLFLLGLLCKPMLVTLPVVLLLLDWWPLRRLSFGIEAGAAAGHSSPTRLVLEKIPFFVLSAGSSSITYLAQQAEGELFQGYTLLSRAGKACISYISYLYKMVWPVDLAILYPFSKYPPGNAKIMGSAILLLLLTMMAFWLGRRFPYLIVGWLWYLVTLLPVIGLIQIGQHSIADRYTYLPLIGIFIMIAWGVPQLLGGYKSRDVALSVMSVVILTVLIILTSLQLRHWKNGFTLFSHAVAVTDNNWVAQNNLGLILLQEGKTDDAIRQFQASIKSKPSYALAYLNLGAAYLTNGEYEKAVDAFTWSIQFDRFSQKAHNGRGLAYVQMGNRERAFSEYQILVELGSPYATELLKMINAASSESGSR